MNKKKVLGAVFAAACAVNFSIATPAQAFSLALPGSTPSASQQEKWAQDNIRSKFNGEEPISDSDLAKEGTPIVRALQKRICDANGIEITTQKYQHGSDHKNKVHPIFVVDNGPVNYAYSYGAGYISFPANSAWIYNITKERRNQYDAFDLEQTIAHELSHNIKGDFGSLLAPGTTEKQADSDSVKLIDPLPEGGWGVYLVYNRRGSGYPKIQEKVRKSFEKETKGKIEIKDNGATVIYHYGNGGWSRLLTSLYTGREDVQDEDAYFGGQLAYCIAKGGLTVDGIDIMENNLKQDLKFQGDYLLICRSAKYPNGYRILAPLYGKDRKKLEYILRTEREAVVSKGDDINAFAPVCEVLLQKYNEHDFWVTWLACAVAQRESK